MAGKARQSRFRLPTETIHRWTNETLLTVGMSEKRHIGCVFLIPCPRDVFSILSNSCLTRV